MTLIESTGELVSRQAMPPVDPSLPNTTKAPRILSSVGFLTGIAAVIVGLRSYVRVWVLKLFGPDDYIMLIAMACSFGVLGCFIGESRHGLGRYSQYITQNDQEILRKYTFYHSLVVMIGISAVKISVGFFLLRVAGQTRFRKFIIGMLIFLILFTSACAGTLIFQCIPVSAAWDLAERLSAKCFSMHMFMSIGLFNSSVNVATDVIFATLPIPMFYNVKVSKRTKASLMAILSLGYLACTAAIVKMVSQSQVFKLQDPYRDSTFITWNCVELNVGILAGSLPTIKPLLKSIIETTRSITSGPRSGPHNRRDSYSTPRNSSIPMGLLKPGEQGGGNRRPDFGLGSNSKKYNVEVSATRMSNSRDGDERDSILLLSSPRKSTELEPPVSAIVRTTEVYVHTDDRDGENHTVGEMKDDEARC
ncbi:hypothetical protein M432DRAFT_543888 [Thermoascus aurantiacus ATCC 26904]